MIITPDLHKIFGRPFGDISMKTRKNVPWPENKIRVGEFSWKYHFYE